MSRGAAKLRGGGLDRLDDALVAGAAAEDGGDKHSPSWWTRAGTAWRVLARSVPKGLGGARRIRACIRERPVDGGPHTAERVAPYRSSQAAWRRPP